MVYEVKDILRDVRIAIDENKTNEQLITDEDIDTLMLDDIIYSKVVGGGASDSYQRTYPLA